MEQPDEDRVITMREVAGLADDLHQGIVATTTMRRTLERQKWLGLGAYAVIALVSAVVLVYLVLSGSRTTAGLLDSCRSNNQAKTAQVELYQTLLRQTPPDPSPSQQTYIDALTKAVGSITITDCEAKYG